MFPHFFIAIRDYVTELQHEGITFLVSRSKSMWIGDYLVLYSITFLHDVTKCQLYGMVRQMRILFRRAFTANYDWEVVDPMVFWSTWFLLDPSKCILHSTREIQNGTVRVCGPYDVAEPDYNSQLTKHAGTPTSLQSDLNEVTYVMTVPHLSSE